MIVENMEIAQHEIDPRLSMPLNFAIIFGDSWGLRNRVVRRERKGKVQWQQQEQGYNSWEKQTEDKHPENHINDDPISQDQLQHEILLDIDYSIYPNINHDFEISKQFSIKGFLELAKLSLVEGNSYYWSCANFLLLIISNKDGHFCLITDHRKLSVQCAPLDYPFLQNLLQLSSKNNQAAMAVYD